MRLYRLEFQREVRLDCTVFIQAENEREAILKFENGSYHHNDCDESEAAELSRDNIVKVTDTNEL